MYPALTCGRLIVQHDSLCKQCYQVEMPTAGHLDSVSITFFTLINGEPASSDSRATRRPAGSLMHIPHLTITQRSNHGMKEETIPSVWPCQFRIRTNQYYLREGYVRLRLKKDFNFHRVMDLFMHIILQAVGRFLMEDSKSGVSCFIVFIGFQLYISMQITFLSFTTKTADRTTN